MSVWCSRLSMDDVWHDELPPPLVYVASHVIPSRDGQRGGSVDTAHLPGFITRDGRDDGNPGDEARPWWPFLRLSVSPAQRPDVAAWRRLTALADRLAATDPELATDVRTAADHEDTVILDVDQVDALIADLTEWRANVGEQQ